MAAAGLGRWLPTGQVLVALVARRHIYARCCVCGRKCLLVDCVAWVQGGAMEQRWRGQALCAAMRVPHAALPLPCPALPCVCTWKTSLSRQKAA